MARAKRQSDEIYNERRRAKRLAARIERQQFATAKESQAARSYVANLRRQIEGTYISRVASREQAAKAAKSLGVQTRRDLGTAEARANEIFARQMNIAGSGAESTLGSMGQAFVKIFYAATQRIWEGLPFEERNRAIMNALGTDSLRDAFKTVLRQQSRAIAAARGAVRPVTDTEENAWFYDEPDEIDDIGSPDYLDYTVQVMQ